MSHNRDLSAAAAQLGFHSSNIGIGTETPGTKLDVRGGNWSNGDIVVGQSGNAGRIKFRRGADGSDSAFIGFAAADNNSRLSIGVDSGDGTIAFQTNSSERLRITSAGRIGINQTSPGAMLQVDYDEGSSEVGLRLRAYNAAGSKTWQLSEINGTPGVFTIRNATNAQNNLSIDGSSGYVGVNATNPDRRLEVVETASSLTFPVAVSNHTDASAGVGAGIAFHLTAGGNARGELGLVYAGNSNSDGTDFVFRPNDGSTGQVERLRITSDGKIGIGHHSAAQITKELTIRPANDGGIMIGRPGDTVTPINAHLLLTTTSAGQVFPSGEAYTVKYNTRNCDAIFTTYEGGGTGGNISFQTGVGNGNQAERLRITDAGYVLKSDTPAFQCKLSTATSNQFNGYLTFTSVRFNIGNHYNSSNGRFTAPVDGRYLFSWYTNMSRYGGNGSLWADWYVNGSAQGNRMYTHHSGAWELIGGTIIMDLNSSDYVQIYTGQPGSWDGGSYGAFSGYLLG